MRTATLDEVTVFNPRKDKIERLRYRKLRIPVTPIKVEVVPKDYDGLDPKDAVRAPILRILMDKEHELDPRRTCIKGDRHACNLYDRLTKVSRDFTRTTTKSERDQILTPPESAFLQGEPTFCKICVLEEHWRRKRENKPWRRLARWLRRIG